MEYIENKETTNCDSEIKSAYITELNDLQRTPENIPQKKRHRSGAGCFFIVLLILLVAALAVSVVFLLITEYKGSKNAYVVPSEGGENSYSSPSPQETNYPVSTPIPLATDRPMAAFDGALPVITDAANPFPEIIEKSQPGVVSILNYGYDTNLFGKKQETLKGSGSGFVISSEGYCVTNAHVISDASRISIVLSDDSEIPCEIIGTDISTDIAVLHFDNATYRVPPLYLGDSDKTRVGDFVITVGDPSGRELAGTITFGIVSAVNRTVNIDGRVNSYIQTDAAMNPGNSGGPLINTHGEVIGVTSAKTVTASYDELGNAISAEGLGFAVPINTVKSVVESLITKGKIERPGLGVTIRPVTDEEMYSLNITYGLYVDSIKENGPTYAAGIRKGDILLSCNGKELHENEDLSEMVKNASVGTVITLTYLHDNETKSVNIILGDLNSMG